MYSAACATIGCACIMAGAGRAAAAAAAAIGSCACHTGAVPAGGVACCCWKGGVLPLTPMSADPVLAGTLGALGTLHAAHTAGPPPEFASVLVVSESGGGAGCSAEQCDGGIGALAGMAALGLVTCLAGRPGCSCSGHATALLLTQTLAPARQARCSVRVGDQRETVIAAYKNSCSTCAATKQPGAGEGDTLTGSAVHSNSHGLLLLRALS